MRVKSSRILCVFGGISLNVSENTAKTVVCVFWLLGNLQILRSNLDGIRCFLQQNISES